MGKLISRFPGSTHFGVGDILRFHANPLIRQINVYTLMASLGSGHDR